MNTENGYMNIYNDSESGTNIISSKDSGIPTKISLYNDLIIISYNSYFTINDFINGFIDDATGFSIRTNQPTEQIIKYGDREVALTTIDHIYIFNLANLLSDITLKEESQNALFASENYFLIEHENDIDIFEISRMI